MVKLQLPNNQAGKNKISVGESVTCRLPIVSKFLHMSFNSTAQLLCRWQLYIGGLIFNCPSAVSSFQIFYTDRRKFNCPAVVSLTTCTIEGEISSTQLPIFELLTLVI